MMHPGPHSHDHGLGASALHPQSGLEPLWWLVLAVAAAAVAYALVRWLGPSSD